MQFSTELVRVIHDGAYAVIPTDTLYGIVCSALNESAVEKLYTIRDREATKPFIVLLADPQQLELFGIDWKKYQRPLSSLWPGPVSIILPCPDAALSYLHRGANSLAFRVPNDDTLRALLAKTGPLVAPSANRAGQPPATTIDEAKKYFGDTVTCYVDNGEMCGTPSTLLRFHEDGTFQKLR